MPGPKGKQSVKSGSRTVARMVSATTSPRSTKSSSPPATKAIQEPPLVGKQMFQMTLQELKINWKACRDKGKKKSYETWIARRERERKEMKS